MQAMLLAAGFGTRLRPHTLVRPKPLFPVLNRPLLDILLDMLEQAGCGRIIVNCHHLADQVRQAAAVRPRVTLQFEPVILGTGGSLRRALPLLADRPLLVMNGDIFHDIDLRAVYEYHCCSGNAVTMVLHDCPRFNSVAVRRDRVCSFSAPGPGEKLLAFTGIHVLEPWVIGRIPDNTFYHVIDLYREMARQGEAIGVMRADGSYWRDMGTPEDYLVLHHDLLTGRAAIPGRAPVATPWLRGEGVELAGEAALEEWGCLGDHVRVGRGVCLRRCVVWEGTRIPDGGTFCDMILAPHLFVSGQGGEG